MSKLVSAVIMTAILLSTDSCVPPGGEAPPAPVTEIIIEVVSNPEGLWAQVGLNAIDHSGLPAVNLETGELYPTEHPYRTPYKHWIVHPPNAVVTYSVKAIIGGEPGDLLGCNMYLNGVKLTVPGSVGVTEIPQGMASAVIRCEYKYFGNGQ